jgi:hypothetical protein
MKIVVSTKVLFCTIIKAIDVQCKSFSITPNINNFCNAKKLVFSTDPDISIDIYIMSEWAHRSETFTFDENQMSKVMKFVHQLQEQPIVVEFDQYEDDKLTIKLSQFEQWF